MFIHTLAGFSCSSGKENVFRDRMMAMSRKSCASLSPLPSLFVSSTGDFESQTIYISIQGLACSHGQEDLFERCTLLELDLENIKTIKHFSSMHM